MRTHKVPACALFLATAAVLGQQIAPNPDDEPLPSRSEIGQKLQFQLNEANNARQRLQLTADHDFEPRARTFDRRGNLYGRFRQRYKGIPVLGAEIILRTPRNGSTPVETASSIHNKLDINVTPQVSEKEALRIATEAYLPERWAGAEPKAKAQLAVYPAPDRDRLVWLIAIDALDLDPKRYLVDAHSAEIVKSWNDFAEDGYQPATGTGVSRWYGEVNLDIAKNEGIAKPYRLMDMKRGSSVVFNNDNKAPSEVAFPGIYDSADNVFGNGEDWKFGGSTWDATGETAAIDVAYGMRVAWDLLLNVFGREGLDDNGSPMYARVHYLKTPGEPYGDARWSGGFINFGDGTTSNASSHTKIDVVGHELGHGVWSYATDYETGSGESRGLNEGHGDIMGALTYIYMKAKNGKGATLPETVPRDYFRSRAVDPSSYSIDGQTGLSYYVDDMGDYEEHVVGCAYGHAFIFLAIGSSSDPSDPLYSTHLPGGMRGIGVHKAAQIWYLATTGYLAGTPSFVKMRTAYLSAATELYGGNSFEYKAVQNAFGGISVGLVAADLHSPEATLPAPTVREDEGSLLINATGNDDVAVSKVQISIDGAVKKTIEQASGFHGHLDISNLDPGYHTVTVKMWDAKNRTDSATRGFTLTGVYDLIKNGRFDAGTNSQWSVLGPAPAVAGSEGAFLGGGYALFTANGSSIAQKVTIPAGTSKATLGFRLRVHNGGQVHPNENFRALLYSSQGTLLDTLDTFGPYTNTNQDNANDYKRYTYDLSQHAGKTVEIRFIAAQTFPGRFRLDNIFLIADAPPSFNLTAVVDEGEDSVVFSIEGFKHMTPEQIKRVDVTIDNQPAGSLTSRPWQFVREAGSYRRLEQHTIRAIAYDHADKRIGQPETAAFSVGPVEQLLRNPGFEQGSLPWIGSQGVKFGVNNGEAQQYFSFLGSRFAYFDESSSLDHTLYQVVTLPASQTNTITMSYRVRIDVLAGNAVGRLRLKVLDTSGNVLGTLDTIDGDYRTDLPPKWRSYEKRTVNLTPYRGKVVRLQFEHKRGDNISLVRYYIDNVSVTTKTPGLAGN